MNNKLKYNQNARALVTHKFSPSYAKTVFGLTVFLFRKWSSFFGIRLVSVCNEMNELFFWQFRSVIHTQCVPFKNETEKVEIDFAAAQPRLSLISFLLKFIVHLSYAIKICLSQVKTKIITDKNIVFSFSHRKMLQIISLLAVK